jgi:cytochrome c biogenesis protein CcmG/thiol:disulfide interchange protein DsbE
MRRWLAILPVVGFLALAGYFAYALRPDHDPNELPSALLDREMPAFALPGLSASTIKGRVALVNIFASWCAPCRLEHPLLMRLARDEKITLYGIAYKDKDADNARFLAELGNPFTAIGLDRDGRTGIDFGVYGVPETYLIDRDGHIRQRWVGPLTPGRVTREVLPALRKLQAG